MNATTLHLSTVPVPCGLALRAPHLIAPIYFYGSNRAFRAWFRVMLDEGYGSYDIGIACMRMRMRNMT